MLFVDKFWHLHLIIYVFTWYFWIEFLIVLILFRPSFL